MPFNDPGTGGDRIDFESVKGALLLFDVKSVEQGISTSFGEKSAIRADVAVLDGAHKADVYADTLIFPLVLQGQLRGSVGEQVLGRLGQGAAKPGQKPPWQLTPASAEDRAIAERYVAHVAAQMAAAEEPF